jgi:hypothetical protein
MSQPYAAPSPAPSFLGLSRSSVGLPRSAAGWTIAIFGALALVIGIVGLISPDTLLRSLGFEVAGIQASGDYTKVFMATSSMASFNMGVYYLLAAALDWRPFFAFTVIFRTVTFTVFTLLVLVGPAPDRFFGVALWEGLGAVATAVALWWEIRRSGATVAYSSDAGR